VSPVLLVPWISVLSKSASKLSNRIAFVLSAGLVATSLASAIQTPASAWAGLSGSRVDTASSWGLQEVAETIRLDADSKSPVDILVLANHSVINYQTVRAELLKTLSLERAIEKTSKVVFYTPPAKDLSHPAVQGATYLLAKSGQGGPSVSWISERAAQFYRVLNQGSGLQVEPMWASPLLLPDNSELMLYKKELP
jgi:hypothetical protein